MSQRDNRQTPKNDLTPEVIRDFIETQKQRALNEAKELQIREKELELGAKNAETAMNHQANYLSKKPVEDRKTLTRIGMILGGVILSILGFISLWLWLGKEDFAYKFLQGGSYVLISALSYWAGKREKKKKDEKKEDDIDDAEIVE